MNSSCHCHLQPLLVPTPAKTRSPTPNRTPNHRCSSHVLSIDPVVLPAGWTRRNQGELHPLGWRCRSDGGSSGEPGLGQDMERWTTASLLGVEKMEHVVVFLLPDTNQLNSLFAKFIPSFPTNHEPVTESRFLVRYLKRVVVFSKGQVTAALNLYAWCVVLGIAVGGLRRLKSRGRLGGSFSLLRRSCLRSLKTEDLTKSQTLHGTGIYTNTSIDP